MPKELRRPWDGPGYAKLFLTTDWPVVQNAVDGDGAAQATLYRMYAQPVYHYFRRSGSSREDAEDLVQTLFTKLLNGKSISNLNPTSGRLRTWLIHCANNLRTDRNRKLGAVKRGSTLPPISWEELQAEERYELEPACENTPEQHYDRIWARAILQHAVDRLRREFEGKVTVSRFDDLKDLLLPDPSAPKYAELAARLKTSEQAIKGAVCRLRKRLREILAEEIGRTVPNTADVVEEMHYLFQALSR